MSNIKPPGPIMMIMKIVFSQSTDLYNIMSHLGVYHWNNSTRIWGKAAAANAKAKADANPIASETLSFFLFTDAAEINNSKWL